jgi:phosphoserine phosphatase RsbU/P
MPILVTESGLTPGTEHRFDTSAVVGRVSTADIVLDHPTVSRRHALIRVAENTCTVVDLGSSNGTFINNRRIARPTQLDDGSIVQFGTVRLVYRSTDVPAPAPSGAGSLGSVLDDRQRTFQPQLAMPATAPAMISALPSAAQTDEVADLSRRMQVLDEVARFGCRVLEQQAVLEYVAEQVLAALPQADRAVVLLRDAATGSLIPAAGRSREGTLSDMRMSRSLLNDIVTRREGVLVTDVPSSAAGMTASLDIMNIRSLLCVPILFDGEVFGAIHADTSRFTQRFTRHDLALILALSSQVGMVLAYARLHTQVVEQKSMEHDVEFARRLQRHFFPQRLPVIPGYDAAASLSAADRLGGDFYDVLQTSPDTFAFLLGDVCGKGIPAALYAAKVGADVRHLSAGQPSPMAVLERLNQTLTQDEREGMFVTLSFAVLRTSSQRILISSAGHPPPILLGRGAAPTRVGPTGSVPLAVDPDSAYAERECRLEIGQSLVFYSDGVTEALRADGEVYGDDRLLAVLAHADGPPQAVIEAVLSDVAAFVGSAKQSDDLTLLCLQRRD